MVIQSLSMYATSHAHGFTPIIEHVSVLLTSDIFQNLSICLITLIQVMTVASTIYFLLLSVDHSVYYVCGSASLL